MTDSTVKPLRHGYTTGSCATATAKAALIALITQEEQTTVRIRIPIGEEVDFQLTRCEFDRDIATTAVTKDGGDDPDATHGATIEAAVMWTDEVGILLDGGIGVGRVTKPGLPVEVGEAAINPVPRKMIREAVQGVLEDYELTHRGVKVIISVPDGEEIAKKTLNGRLGILGGISILGTRGIVVPFSTSAYKASIAQAVRVAERCGCDHIVLSTGGRSEKFGIELYPELSEEAFVEMGDFVGAALTMCKRQGIRKVTLVGMMGKFSKVAEGVMMVHSKSSSVNFPFLADVAAQVGESDEIIEEILGANTASQVGDMMVARGNMAFFQRLCELCCQTSLKQVQGEMEIETVIITLKGELLGRTRLG